MSSGVNINGLDVNAALETAFAFIERARKRAGRNCEFIVYIDKGYMFTAVEDSKRFDKFLGTSNYLGTYNPRIDPADLAQDMVWMVDQYRRQHESHHS